MEVIIDAKERQAAEANKNATILLQEIDQEKVGAGISLLAVDFRKKLKQTQLSWHRGNCYVKLFTFSIFFHRNMKKTVKQQQPENERRRRDKRKRNRLSSNSITVMRRRKKVYDIFFPTQSP